MARRCGQALNEALVELFETRDDVYLLGEDLLDPYGGAFKISQGLSTRWPDRVLTTPVSEPSLFGVAAGMALRGSRPILEKLLLGVPGLCVVAPSESHDVGGLLKAAVDDDRPVFFIENKLMYGRTERRPESGRIDGFVCEESAGPYPVLTLSGNGFARADATIATYGGSLPVALEAATQLILERELFTEVVVLSRLLPMDLDPVLASLGRTGALVTVEEGCLTGGFGAELTALVQEAGWDSLRRPIRRVAADDGIIPAARGLEDAMLPGIDDVVEAVEATVLGP
jgi:2-oxoisovalerate dehydrogenase E1 component